MIWGSNIYQMAISAEDSIHFHYFSKCGKFKYFTVTKYFSGHPYYVKWKRCYEHLINICACGWEYGYHDDKSSRVLNPPSPYNPLTNWRKLTTKLWLIFLPNRFRFTFNSCRISHRWNSQTSTEALEKRGWNTGRKSAYKVFAWDETVATGGSQKR